MLQLLWERVKVKYLWQSVQINYIIATMQQLHISVDKMDAVLCSRVFYMTIADSPMSIVRMCDDKQIAVNQRLLDELETTGRLATNRNMANFWLPEVKAELDRKLASERLFTWTYEASLGKRYCQLTALFEQFEDNEGTEYRQVTLIAPPIEKEFPSGLCSVEQVGC